MPVIPTKTEVITPRSTALGRVSAADMPGIETQSQLKQFSALTKTLGALGPALLSRQAKLKKERDDLNVSEANLTFKNAINQQIIDYETFRGKDTEGVSARLRGDFTTFENQIGQNLTEEQREAFQRSIAPYKANSLYRISRFERVSHEDRIRSNYDGQSAADTTSALENYNNPGAFYEFLDKATAAKQRRLELDGVDENLIQESNKQYRSKTLTAAIGRLASDSLKTGELWFEKAKKDKELTFNDEFKLTQYFDRAKKAQEKNNIDTEAQLTLDKLIADKGEDRGVLSAIIRKNYTGAMRDELIRRLDARHREMEDIEADTQAQILIDVKEMVSESPTYQDAMRKLDQVRPSLKFPVIEQAEKFIRSRYLTNQANRRTNLSKFQEARILTDKSFAGTAVKKDQIRNVDDLIVRYEPFVNPSDMKILIRNFNAGGNISGLTESKAKNAFQFYTQATDKQIDTDKGTKETYHDFYRFLVSRIEPGVELTDPKLKELGATFFAVGLRGGFFSWLGFGDNETYGEAIEEGEELTWLPQLNDQQKEVAERKRVELNRALQQEGKATLGTSETDLSKVYKLTVLKLRHEGF